MQRCEFCILRKLTPVDLHKFFVIRQYGEEVNLRASIRKPTKTFLDVFWLIRFVTNCYNLFFEKVRLYSLCGALARVGCFFTGWARDFFATKVRRKNKRTKSSSISIHQHDYRGNPRGVCQIIKCMRRNFFFPADLYSLEDWPSTHSHRLHNGW